MHSRSSLSRDFSRAGLAAGDAVFLHASVRAVGEVAGGPDQIHLALRDSIGPAGTLMMYTSCPDGYDEVGRGTLPPEREAELIALLPAFDPITARSARDNGALVEMFRTWPGTRVNQHVTRFAVAGGAADFILSEQPWDWAMGAGSPLEKFLELDGKIVLLGSDHDQVTFLHYVEHVAEFPDKIVARFQVPVMEGGKRVWREMAEVDSAERAHANWPDRFFAILVDGYLAATGNHGARVGDAQTYVFSVRGLFDYARPRMEQAAAGDFTGILKAGARS